MKKKDKKELWIRIRSYQFEDLVPPGLEEKITAFFKGENAGFLAFSDKIARKHQWTRDFACRAVEEYKKFTFLAVISKFQVTPSKNIDTAWHEHILFSRAYRDYCSKILRHTLDHHPELFPADQQTIRYSQQFKSTIKLYTQEFGHEPPGDVWGLAKFKKRESNDDFSSCGGWSSTDEPLHSIFEGQGGEFHGAGASGSWEDASSDSGSSDSGGGDSGAGCSGGCSSGCGGD